MPGMTHAACTTDGDMPNELPASMGTDGHVLFIRHLCTANPAKQIVLTVCKGAAPFKSADRPSLICPSFFDLQT